MLILTAILLPFALAQTAPNTAAPDLTEQQFLQLSTASDHSEQFDEGALYPLLNNAIWLRDEDTTATPPLDYAAVEQSPADHRGKLFIIQGVLAAPPRPTGRLARPGPWDSRLQQWIIQTNPKTDQVVVAFLVDPPPEKSRPRVGDRVKLFARFYKIWNQKRVSDSKTIPFLAFVGKTAQLATPAQFAPNNQSPIPLFSSRSATFAVVGLGLLLGILYFFFRSKLGLPSQAGDHRRERIRRRRERDMDSSPRPTPPEPDPTLPENPADALAELHRRNDQTN